MRISYVMMLAVSLLAFCGCADSRERLDINIEKGDSMTVELDSMQSALEIIGSARESARLRKYTFVKYVNSIQCSECVVKNLRQWVAFQDVFDEHPQTLSLVIILAPQKHQRKLLYEELTKDTLMSENIYIDSLRVFERMNPGLPQNPFTNCYLIDENNKVLIIGDPTYDDNVEREFMTILDTIP